MILNLCSFAPEWRAASMARGPGHRDTKQSLPLSPTFGAMPLARPLFSKSYNSVCNCLSGDFKSA